MMNDKKQQELYQNYQNIWDKRLALEIGRIYSSSKIPNKELTIYDEQDITNDLSTMN